ncbi:CobT Cobalamin biosynthesis protein CobT (nicotinate-mononucleotide,5, 6-dimethylbenzimidazole phosphoribosyltransferase) [uncultured Caudovirales phage]|uniref:CobT Cobalamin biosynthesis protein CobT (Nicotinate-mononucleotide,5, 6-dimethylbenzimidazole phosphoribosyltransferase) n=1 Tax=uncultured Caudovirales phage TaxID=2100421 RepID=A0A6J5NUC6_9CAUD|nr:CobT Cobalamin biosynthesis protein CobT (nicotinate-mononucleotide,5, 6-dimethylbenzimidazole phosphoribosyltransferase) [uncultured Caudovirales phage]
MLKTALLKHELTNTTRHFGKSGKIEVVMRGKQAMTNGKLVVLPEFDHRADLSDEDIRVLRGYVDHEAGGHCVHTTGNHMQEASKRDPKGLLPALLNALEDVRIDARHCEDYPGAAKNLRATAARVTEVYWESIKDKPELASQLRAVGPLAITWLGRTKAGLGSPEVDRCLANTPAEILDLLRPFVDRALKAKNTKQVYEVASELYDSLPPPPPPPPPQPQPQKSKDKKPSDPQDSDQSGGGGKPDPDPDADKDEDAKPDPSADESKGQGNTNPDPSASESPADDDDSDDDTDGDGDSDDTDDGDDEDDADDDDSDGDGDQTGGQTVNAGGDGAGGYDGAPINADLKQAIEKLFKPQDDGLAPFRAHPDAKIVWHDKPSPDASAFTTMRSQILGHVGVMCRTFERILQSSMMRDRERGLSIGRLDSRRLTQAALGNERVFWMPGDRPEMDTAVMVLADMSSSMWDNDGHGTEARLKVQGKALIAIGETLDRINVPFAVHGYSAQKNEKNWKAYGGASSADSYHRLHDLHLVKGKGFNERLVVARGTMGHIATNAQGGTPTADAIMEASVLLAKRTESRKILIVLTDGAPDHDHLAKHAVQDLERHGFDVVGIGIGDDTVRKHFTRYAVVRTADELSKAMLTELSKSMLPSDRRAA